MKRFARSFTFLLVLLMPSMLVPCSRNFATEPMAVATEPRSFKTTNYSVRCVAISPDGKTLAVGGSASSRIKDGLNEGIIKLYDISNGRETATFWQSGEVKNVETRNSVCTLVFSPDGKILVGGDALGYRLWEVGTGKELHFLHDGLAYMGAAFSPDGKTLAVPSNNFGPDAKRGARLVEVATGREIGVLPLMGGGFFHSVDFTPDGKWLVTAGQDRNVTVWNLSTRTVVYKDEVHSPLYCARFSPDGRHLVATGEGGGTIYKVIEKDKKRTVEKLRDSPGGFPCATYSVGFSPNGKTLFADSRANIYLFDAKTWRDLKTIRSRGIAFSRDGKLLAEADSKGEVVKIWDAEKYLEQK